MVLAAEPLFLLVDTAVVGHLGQVPLAALGAAGTVMTLLAIVGSSLEYGTTGRAARAFGAGRRADAVNEGVQASWLALMIGVVVTIVGQLAAGPIARAIAGGGGAVASATESWLRIAMLGLPGILLVLAGNGWLRGVQDTRTPVRIVLIANAISAAASPILVYPAGLGLEGSAIANVAAQAIGGALCVRALRRAHVPMRPQWSVMRRQLVVSRDLVIRAIGFQASFMTAAAVAGRMGAAILAAHQIGLQLWVFVALLLDSFAIAAQSLVGAALGGGSIAGARLTAWRVAIYGLVAGLAFTAVFAAGWELIPRLFTSDGAVQHQAHLLWPILVGMLPASGLLFALDGVLIGAGDNAFMAILTLVAALGAFVPVTILAGQLDWGVRGIWLGLGAFIGVRLIGMVLRVRGSRWLVTGAAP